MSLDEPFLDEDMQTIKRIFCLNLGDTLNFISLRV